MVEVNGQNVVGLKVGILFQSAGVQYMQCDRQFLFLFYQDKETKQIIDQGDRSVTFTIVPTFVFKHIMKKYVVSINVNCIFLTTD